MIASEFHHDLSPSTHEDGVQSIHYYTGIK